MDGMKQQNKEKQLTHWRIENITQTAFNYTNCPLSHFMWLNLSFTDVKPSCKILIFFYITAYIKLIITDKNESKVL